MKEYIVAVPEHLAGDLFRGDSELIRCGECKHFNESNCPMVIRYTVKKEEKSSGWYETFRNTADDFCSRAERKDNG